MIVLGTKAVPTSSLLDSEQEEVFKYVTVKETVTYHGTGQPSSTSTSEADRNGPDSPSGPDLATIVGPVVPSVVLLIVLIFIGFWWYKKREKIKDQEAQNEVDQEEPKVEKAQLHSDCISRPTYELEGSTPMVPDPISPDGAEMAANEVAAHEMPTGKKLGERRTEESEEVQITTEGNKTAKIKTEECKTEGSKPNEGESGGRDNDATGTSK
ncbi:hypothetical protein N0V84_007306 [Fusarium piperis]|uniref:Uncharacterized protein n=1 Tax=Fusarium piperis TaxID=1435070 RepID=A0A9W9BNT1_9HYPO|nr:hypothetical protein N0V84_007306 [Fusarium piperis]